MSTCPTKDIHSLYLDDEMPEIYKTEYEAHLSNCPKCRLELERLKSLKVMLHSDSEDELSDNSLDESYARLLTKMNYSKHVGRAEKKNSFGLKYIIPAAAAAVLAVGIPLTVQKTGVGEASSAETALAAPVLQNSNSIANISFGSGRNVSISDNMNAAGFSSANVSSNGFVREVSGNSVNGKSVAKKLIKDVDVFRPDFAEEKSKTIKITVPNMNAIPFTLEIEFPDSVERAFGSEFNK